jgi:hypothetical protein
MVKVLGKKVSSKGNPKSRTSNGKVSLRQTAGVLRQKQKQKQKQSVIININTNKIRNRSRVTPNIKPSYLQTITTYPIFREASYQPLYNNSEPIREVSAPFIDKSSITMVNTPPISQRLNEASPVNKVPMVNEVPMVNDETPSSKILKKIREASAVRQNMFADAYDKQNSDQFKRTKAFTDSFREQNQGAVLKSKANPYGENKANPFGETPSPSKRNLNRAFEQQTPMTPSFKLKQKANEETYERRKAYERRRAYDESPTPTPIRTRTPTPARRESLLPRPRGRPATVLTDPIEETKRLATNAAAREKRLAIKKTLSEKP